MKRSPQAHLDTSPPVKGLVGELVQQGGGAAQRAHRRRPCLAPPFASRAPRCPPEHQGAAPSATAFDESACGGNLPAGHSKGWLGSWCRGGAEDPVHSLLRGARLNRGLLHPAPSPPYEVHWTVQASRRPTTCPTLKDTTERHATSLLPKYHAPPATGDQALCFKAAVAIDEGTFAVWNGAQANAKLPNELCCPALPLAWPAASHLGNQHAESRQAAAAAAAAVAAAAAAAAAATTAAAAVTSPDAATGDGLDGGWASTGEQRGAAVAGHALLAGGQVGCHLFGEAGDAKIRSRALLSSM